MVSNANRLLLIVVVTLLTVTMVPVSAQTSAHDASNPEAFERPSRATTGTFSRPLTNPVGDEAANVSVDMETFIGAGASVSVFVATNPSVNASATISLGCQIAAAEANAQDEALPIRGNRSFSFEVRPLVAPMDPEPVTVYFL